VNKFCCLETWDNAQMCVEETAGHPGASTRLFSRWNFRKSEEADRRTLVGRMVLGYVHVLMKCYCR
jgi:hypothetical protein